MNASVFRVHSMLILYLKETLETMLSLLSATAAISMILREYLLRKKAYWTKNVKTNLQIIFFFNTSELL